jgi:hypothetical protein
MEEKGYWFLFCWLFLTASCFYSFIIPQFLFRNNSTAGRGDLGACWGRHFHTENGFLIGIRGKNLLHFHWIQLCFAGFPAFHLHAEMKIISSWFADGTDFLVSGYLKSAFCTSSACFDDLHHGFFQNSTFEHSLDLDFFPLALNAKNMASVSLFSRLPHPQSTKRLLLETDL